jgi:hypothetical protein
LWLNIPDGREILYLTFFDAMKNMIKRPFAVFVLVLLAISCSVTYHFRNDYADTNALMHGTSQLAVKYFLKVHMKNGDVCILKDNWQVDSASSAVVGSGTRYNLNRAQVFEGKMSITPDSIALLETNKKLDGAEAGRIGGLALLTGVDALVGIFCIANPKACYGSCPTFYLNEKDNFHYADAEGFSNAILPSMEYADIDALGRCETGKESFSLTLKNEALETHCVKGVSLLAVPVGKEERVFQTPGDQLFRCSNPVRVASATADEGDITALIAAADRQERFSPSDEKDLNSKEEVELKFRTGHFGGSRGLVLHFRQTLMTTYLFYGAMGYMGDEASDYFARLESDSSLRQRFDATTSLLGGIDAYLWSDEKKEWIYQQSFSETGPIAINKQLIPFRDSVYGKEVRVKLVMNRGLWRIDYAGLTDLLEPVRPAELLPVALYDKGRLDGDALGQLNSPKEYLLSMPGSEYRLEFRLPPHEGGMELFLRSEGYYLEWMRAHWIKDKDLLKLKAMVDYPSFYLRSEAKDFKRYEAMMEQDFWGSRIDTKSFNYHAY